MARNPIFASHWCRLSVLVGLLLAHDNGARAQEVWGEKGSFPERVVELLETKKKVWSSSYIYSSVAEDRREVQAAIDALVASIKGQRVKAILSVMSNSEGVVTLLPDVTYGFPTRPPLEIKVAPMWHLPQHSAVLLEETGSGKETSRLRLIVGDTIREKDAKYLSWNDKVLVDFVVDGVELRNIRPSRLSRQEERLLKVEGKEPQEEKGPHCTVRISDFRFLEPKVSELVNSHRTWLWPGPGTLPYSLASFDGPSGNSPVGISLFSDYASLNRFQGSAVFKLLEVHDDEVAFSSGPMWSEAEEAQLTFGGYRIDLNYGGPRKRNRASPLSVPLSEFTADEVARLRRKPDFVLLHFDVVLPKGTVSPSQYWDGCVIHPTNFRLGSDREFQEAMRILPSLEEMATQYEFAIQKEEELLIAAGDEAAAEAARAEAEKNLAMANRGTETGPTTPVASSGSLSFAWDFLKSRWNLGVTVGTVMSCLGAISYIGQFFFGRR